MTVHFAWPRRRDARRRSTAAAAPLAVLGVLAVALTVVFTGAPHARAAQAPVGLGTADSFAVLAGTTVTNTGASVISGDLGVSPGTAVTGFPPGTVNGVIHQADAVAAQAQSDLTAAYNDAAGRGPATAESADLGGQTLTPGVYASTSTPNLTGTVTLDAQGDPSAVFIFQMTSTLITASGSNVALINGAQACNVFWQVGSSATLGTNSTFRGSILALTSITANT
ncbi:MAG TPA: ice-binding family protein, partial [Actinocrinis sp.]|uniref:ice-binding family protein n=1 Tax=Actinocrinis sp. TaxID=1920516 RepID=UPI002DDDBB0B